MLPTAPTMASQVMSASTAAPNSRNLPMNPAQGREAGQREHRDGHHDAEQRPRAAVAGAGPRAVSPSSTSRSRTITTAKAAIVIAP